MSPEKIYVQDKLIFCPNGYLGKEDKDDYFSWKEIPRDALNMGNILGQGEFGLVVKAVVSEENGVETPVAVKSIKGTGPLVLPATGCIKHVCLKVG